MRIRFSIPGNPTAQKRHRTVTRGKGGRPLPYPIQYDESESDKADFLSLCMANRPKQPVEGLVILSLAFWMPVPKGYSKKFKARVAEWDEANINYPRSIVLSFHKPLAHIKRPDVDNLIKLVLDALKGTYWKDDTQVQIRCAFKLYSHSPRTELEIYLEKGEHRGRGENTSS